MADSTADEPNNVSALDTSDRSRPISLPGTAEVYPATVEFNDMSLVPDRDLFGRDLWFDLNAVKQGGIIQRYVYSDGVLPGYTSFSAMKTQTWSMRFCCRNDDLRFQWQASLIDARKAFARQAYNSINCLLLFREVPNKYHVDAILYRTFGEVPYVEYLEVVTAIQPNHCRQHILNSSPGVIVVNQAIVFGRAQIFAEFR